MADDCFWTDLKGVSEDCGGDTPPPADFVRGVLFKIPASPYFKVVAWDETAGTLDDTWLANTSTPVAIRYFAIHPSGRYIAVSTTTTPGAIYVYEITAAGIVDHSHITLGGSTLSNGVGWSHSGAALFYSIGAAPWVVAVPWDAVGGFGTAYAAPSGLAKSPYRFRASPGAVVMNYVNSGSPTTVGIHWDDTTGFGSVYTAPGTMPTYASDFVFNHAGSQLFYANSTANNNQRYFPWSDSTGFGATVQLSGLTSIAVDSPIYSLDDASLILRTGTGLTYFPWNGGSYGAAAGTYGTSFAGGGTNPGANPVQMSEEGDLIIVAKGSSPYFVGVQWNNPGFGSAVPTPPSGLNLAAEVPTWAGFIKIPTT